MRICLILILFTSVALHGDLTSLESLTGEWIRLRTERARESETWQKEQARLRMELRLLEDAEDHLNEELDSLRAEESETETEQADLIEDLELRQSLRDTLTPLVQRALSTALETTEALPPPLLRRLEDERASADAAGEDLLPRVRALLGLHNQWLQLQTALHADSMVMDLAGARREMEVLWIGAAKAFAVNGDATLAAVGTPGPDGWAWTEALTIAPRVRQALRIHRQDAPPALIRLPVHIPEHTDAEGAQ
ncbi:MAG: DUF3450 family protein [Verrucomicrobia bacterium]|nr:DUF3450 family protein [Verrucomicrobiota bacterium]MCH8525762.1 DUF3450 domain-containing protein [Kiritimatiellia bacterium]